jgi:hypothetical protein
MPKKYTKKLMQVPYNSIRILVKDVEVKGKVLKR